MGISDQMHQGRFDHHLYTIFVHFHSSIFRNATPGVQYTFPVTKSGSQKSGLMSIYGILQITEPQFEKLMSDNDICDRGRFTMKAAFERLLVQLTLDPNCFCVVTKSGALFSVFYRPWEKTTLQASESNRTCSSKCCELH